MKKYIILAIILLAIVIILLVGIIAYLKFSSSREDNETSETTTSTSTPKLKLDEEKEETHLSKVLDTKNVYWQRMFELYWNDVEETEGDFDWDFVDERIKEFNQMEIYPVVTIKPFTNWDQDACHGSEYEAEYEVEKGGNVKVGKPCDMDAYTNFLKKAVERYDGDGTDDMPGLTIPVKYWEIMNEPSMQGENTGGMGEVLKFFVGSSDDYLEILKASYEVIKEADSEAQVIQGGQAGMQDEFIDFWEPILEKGGGDYFDIANIHSISTNSKREALFVIKFKEFLKEYDISDKPIWITEVQIGSLTEEPSSSELKDFETLLVKCSVFSLAQGASKLFYIENWIHWADGWNKEIDFEEVKNLSTHEVYLNLINKINSFDEILAIKEKFIEYPESNDGAFSEIGQYKFIDGDSVVYVLWGEAEVPSEISGTISVTDIYGNIQSMDASELNLTEEPVFVEVVGVD